MIKRELRINLKSFLIWLIVLISIFGIVFIMYPSIMNSENIQMMNEMLKVFPEEMLKAFNMDISNIDTAFGWLKTEGFVFVLLITGIYSGILGSSILLKEENDKTIEYLNSLPVTRKNIVISKILSSVIYIILMIFILGLFNFIGLSIIEEFDKKLFVLLSITPLFSCLVIFALCLLISTFTHKTRKTLGISLAIVFVSYFLQIISEMSETTEFLKYISIFTLADIRNVITNITINPIMILLTIILFMLFTIITIIHYNKKELI